MLNLSLASLLAPFIRSSQTIDPCPLEVVYSFIILDFLFNISSTAKEQLNQSIIAIHNGTLEHIDLMILYQGLRAGNRLAGARGLPRRGQAKKL